MRSSEREGEDFDKRTQVDLDGYARTTRPRLGRDQELARD